MKGVRGVVGVFGVVSEPPPVARFDGMDLEEIVLFSAAARRPKNMRDAVIDSILFARVSVSVNRRKASVDLPESKGPEHGFILGGVGQSEVQLEGG